MYGVLSSGARRRVVSWKSTDVSEEPAYCLIHPGLSLGLLFNPEYGEDIFLRNVGWLAPDYTVSYPRRQACLTVLLCTSTSQIYPRSQLIIFILFCLFTTCFGPYGPSSGETQHHLYIYMKTIIPQHIRYNYSLIWCIYLIIYLSIYNHIMVIVSIK
jgi:hypothetical protein